MKTTRLALAALVSCGLVAGIGGISYAAGSADVEPAHVAADPCLRAPDGPLAVEDAAPTEEPTQEPAPTEEPTRDPAPTEEPTRDPAPVEEPTQEPAPAPTGRPGPPPGRSPQGLRGGHLGARALPASAPVARAAAQDGGSSRADGAGVGYDCEDYDTPVSAGRNASARLANTGSLTAVVGGLAGMSLAGGVALVAARKRD
mgnify:CR=1 FL=1